MQVKIFKTNLKISIMKNPNIKIKSHFMPDGTEIKYMDVSKQKENNDCVSVLSMAIMRLSTKRIDFVAINKRIFTYGMFEFKTSEKFNSSKALKLFIFQYEIEFYNEILK